MSYGKTKRQEHIAKVRRMLVMNSEASILEVRKMLISHFGLKLDKDYINKIINIVRKERTKRMDYYTLNVKLAEFEDKLKESDLELWKIVNDLSVRNKDRISALKEIRNNNKELFNKQFDAGLFSRKLGTLDLSTADVLDIINRNVDSKTDTDNQ